MATQFEQEIVLKENSTPQNAEFLLSKEDLGLFFLCMGSLDKFEFWLFDSTLYYSREIENCRD